MSLCISKENSKIGKIANISLTPGKSCGNVPCMKECYAMKAFRMYPSVRNAWDGNLTLWQTSPEKFLFELEAFLRKYKGNLFRWHVAGDIPSADYFTMMVYIAAEFPRIKFLAFTKNYSVVNHYSGKIPENLKIILSAWPGYDMPNTKNLPVAFYQDGTVETPENVKDCSGKCDECFICWEMVNGDSVQFIKH
jgi:hypothetical protein